MELRVGHRGWSLFPTSKKTGKKGFHAQEPHKALLGFKTSTLIYLESVGEKIATPKCVSLSGGLFTFEESKVLGSLASVVSDSVRPHRRQPTRLPRPWDSPGKNTGVGCHFLLPCMKMKSQSEVAQLCPTLCNPRDGSPPGSPIPGILQARTLEWVAISFSNA